MTTLTLEHRPQAALETVKKANHRANLIRVGDILPHTNADTLELILIEGYQVVVKKGEFKTGDLAVYIQPDSVVPVTEPFRFIWEPYQVERAASPDACKHEVISGTLTKESVFAVGTVIESCLKCGLTAKKRDVPEKRRRITVRKFRGEWSEGLLLPIRDFAPRSSPPTLEQAKEGFIKYSDDEDGRLTAGRRTSETEAWYQRDVQVGDDLSEALGITHYDPDKGKESTGIGTTHIGPKVRKFKRPTTLKGWFYYLLHLLKVRRDERFHTEAVGLNLPVYDVEALKNYKNAIEPGMAVTVTEKIHGSNARFVFLDGKMYAGSRTLWKSPESNCTWRKALTQNPWIEEWCRAHEGFALYGEVVPTQRGFDYGCKPGEIKFFVFDIRTPEGTWVDEQDDLTDELGAHSVPVVLVSYFDAEEVKALASGPSLVPGANHIREGVVVKTATEQRKPGVGRLQLKVVSNEFLAKDSK
jgi:hypothetical protein